MARDNRYGLRADQVCFDREIDKRGKRSYITVAGSRASYGALVVPNSAVDEWK